MKDPFRRIQGGPKLLDFGKGIVEIEAGPGGRPHVVTIVQRHGVMVPGTDGDAGAVQDFGHVVGVDLVERETDDSRLVPRSRPQDPQALDALQDLVGRVTSNRS